MKSCTKLELTTFEAKKKELASLYAQSLLAHESTKALFPKDPQAALQRFNEFAPFMETELEVVMRAEHSLAFTISDASGLHGFVIFNKESASQAQKQLAALQKPYKAFKNKHAEKGEELDSQVHAEFMMKDQACRHIVKAPNMFIIEHFAVDSAHQRKGYGTALIRSVFQEAVTAKEAVVVICPLEPSTVAFLHKCGFEKKKDISHKTKEVKHPGMGLFMIKPEKMHSWLAQLQ